MQFPKLTHVVDAAYESRVALWVIRLSIFILSGIFAFLLRFEMDLNRRTELQMVTAIAAWLVLKTVVFRALAIDREFSNYASLPDLVHVVFGNIIASCFAVPFILLVTAGHFPRSVFLLDLIICTNMIAIMRLAPRFLMVRASRHTSRELKRVLIYGAGQAGITLLSEIRQNPRLAYDVVGFIDDSSKKVGMYVQRVPVLGQGVDLPDIRKKRSVQDVLIAIPSADGPMMTEILSHCHRAQMKCKTIPGLAEFIDGRALAPQIRDVAVQDLLGRAPVSLDETAIRTRLEDAVVLITGAAGSIGSELCRQIARFGPRAIVGFEIAETPLFYVDSEMRATFPGVQFHSEIGSIQNAQRLSEVMKQYSPSIVFHAAAYKHVPMMEAHLFEAVENNVLGTLNVAVAAASHGVADFVMISSDKAVRPTNVMGATKRIAEILVKTLQNGSTKFVSVRFGNVLGSNGSVVPIFKRQIAAGGPVLVTHPEMQRYFMTTPEASLLVLQAATMGHGGEIFVLDMGKPVRIVDLARNLILLSGLRPDEDIRIEFSGVRPGEKLYEELSSVGENTVATFHNKIRIFSAPSAVFDDLSPQLNEMDALCRARNAGGLLLLIKELVPEYNPSADILSKILAAKVDVSSENELFGRHRAVAMSA
jgi:FlaA1/EpsC-like NDP-sugar epimerase